MPTPDDLVSAIDSLGTTQWSSTTYRHASPDRDPLSGEGARKSGGRWNPSALFPTLYLADSVETSVAEFERMAAMQGLSPEDFLPRDLHEIECRNLDVLDIRDNRALESLGLTDADISSADWDRCQAVGEAAHFLGFHAVIAPSAASRRGYTIAVFDDIVPSGAIVHISTRQLHMG